MTELEASARATEILADAFRKAMDRTSDRLAAEGISVPTVAAQVTVANAIADILAYNPLAKRALAAMLAPPSADAVH
jgi:methanogenic corrinoid protein MtbC1